MTAASQERPWPLEMYRSMRTIRRFEERGIELRQADVIAGSIPLCLGQEALLVGVRAGLRVGDRAVATYRGHGWSIAWGVPLDGLMAEICHRATGVNRGRGGAAYLTAPECDLGDHRIACPLRDDGARRAGSPAPPAGAGHGLSLRSDPRERAAFEIVGSAARDSIRVGST